MRILRRILLIATILSAPILIAFQEKWQTSEGTSYVIKFDGSKDEARDLLKFMDTYIYPSYKIMLNIPDWNATKKFTIKLYADKEEFKESSDIEGATAYYDPNSKELVGYSAKPEKMFAFFAHEGMHQFTDMAIQNFDRMPSWYIEGVADCIGNCKLDGKKLWFSVKDGWLAQNQRLPVLQDALDSGKYIKLSKLLYYDQKEFYEHAEVAYAEGWGLCQFLFNAPYKEPVKEGKNQKFKGKYKQVIIDFHNLMARDKNIGLSEAYKKTFIYKGKPINVDELEKEWKDYILNFNNDDEKKKNEK